MYNDPDSILFATFPKSLECIKAELKKYNLYMNTHNVAEYLRLREAHARQVMHSLGFPLQNRVPGMRRKMYVHQDDFAIWLKTPWNDRTGKSIYSNDIDGSAIDSILSPKAQRTADELSKYGTFIKSNELAEYFGLPVSSVRLTMNTKGFPLQPRLRGCAKYLRVHRIDFAVWHNKQ
jgi:hypothetical protein